MRKNRRNKKSEIDEMTELVGDVGKIDFVMEKRNEETAMPTEYEEIDSGREDIAETSHPDIPISRRSPDGKNPDMVNSLGGRSIEQETIFEDQKSNKKNSKKSVSKKRRRRRRIGITVFVSIIVLLIGIIGTGVWYVYDLTKDIDFEDPSNGDSQQEEQNDDFGLHEETLSFRTMYDVATADSLEDYLIEWSNNGGEIIYSKNVTNVLLLGEDGDATATQNGRSDCMMLVSINRQAKKIILTSLMRDSYCSYDVQGQTQYGKLNNANLQSGYPGLIKTIENLYKIDIDYYLSVNFNSFPKLIDALGGVSVAIQQYEAEYINETTTAIKKVTYGDSVKLDGDQALVFCRIRHCDADSDVSRTRRQRLVIQAIINSTKDASNGQLLNAIKQVAPYIKTNMNQNTMIRFGTAALLQKWISYEMQEFTMPDEETRIDATIGGQSCWVIDYPKAAQKVQQNIYGITNIVLASQRLSLEELKSMGENSGSFYYGYDDYDDYYDDYYYDDYYDYWW